MFKLQGVQETDLIEPKFMVIRSCGVLQHTDQHRHGLGAALTGLAHDAKAPILGQGTGGPTLLNVRFKPLGGMNRVNMITVMQSDQHIDVKNARIKHPQHRASVRSAHC